MSNAGGEEEEKPREKAIRLHDGRGKHEGVRGRQVIAGCMQVAGRVAEPNVASCLIAIEIAKTITEKGLF